MSSARLIFLGSGDSQGVPRWWCECSVCSEARSTGANARTRPSVLIRGSENVLIDSSPEFRRQVERAGVRQLDAVLITHAHNDHLLGVGDIADYAARVRRDCPVYAPAAVIPEIQARFAYMLKPGTGYAKYTPILPLDDSSRAFAGYAVQAVEVPHGRNGSSWAYRFERNGRAWGYMSDCLDLVDLKPWRNLDLLVLGANFYREDAARDRRSIYDVLEAAELLNELAPARAVLTHMGHGVDRRKAAPAGVSYACDGLEIELP
jgi:phosphoribosyl 1,2-cyclic phosphate phosphodiesterase